MVEIEYQPCKKIVVHEIRRMKVPDLFQWMASGAEAQKAGCIASVNWADGVAFVTRPFFPIPQVLEDSLKGITHYLTVYFTETSFEAEKKGSLKDGRPYTVRLIRVEHNPDFLELAKFLKKFNSGEHPTTANTPEGSESVGEKPTMPMKNMNGPSVLAFYS
ncbi:MAG: hypothetical protein ABSB53_03885 [Nitrososphaerales archaeon]